MSSERHAMSHLGNLIADRGWASAILGVEMENYYHTARAHQVLTEFHAGRMQDAILLVNWCRAVKSETEIAFMRCAARIVKNMHKAIFDHMRPGLRKKELAAEISRTGLLGGKDEEGTLGGDYPAIVPLLPSGLDATAAHLTWDDQKLEAGAATFFEIAGCYRRYYAPLCRTVYLGAPPRDMLAAEEALQEGIANSIVAARPGNTAGDVARALYAGLEKYGIACDGRCGYPIGLSYPPDWGERTFFIRTDEETVLRHNMTFHLMPALWMDEWGLEITKPLLVDESGPAICLADYPRKLFVKT